MKLHFIILLLFTNLLFSNQNTCLECHKSIADIRDKNSGMMKEILKVAGKAGAKGNDCIVYHGGNPNEKDKEKPHNAPKLTKVQKIFTPTLQAHG